MLSRFMSMALLLLIAPATLTADEPKKIRGRVTDGDGRPARGASVSAFWGANGLDWDQVVALGNKEPERLWQREGKMEPWGDVRPAMTDADGRFSIPAPGRRKTLMICDRERRHGAVVYFDPEHPEAHAEVRLAPLVRVFGTNKLSGLEGPLTWTCTYLHLPFEENDPLNNTKIAICGSYHARFEFLIPPGTYNFSASSDSPSSETLEPRSVTVTAEQTEVDLGALILRPRIGGFQDRVDRSRARGTWADYKQNFGKEPPPWHLTDARGVAKDSKLSDFKGKWVVLYFWGPNCAPCLGKQLPELMEFYEAHKARRDRFEILAFCCDFSETLTDIAALERQLRHVRKAVWDGRELPFPVLLDNTFQTYERFGLEGISSILLIDPRGKLVEGSMQDLEKILASPARSRG